MVVEARPQTTTGKSTLDVPCLIGPFREALGSPKDVLTSYRWFEWPGSSSSPVYLSATKTQYLVFLLSLSKFPALVLSFRVLAFSVIYMLLL